MVASDISAELSDDSEAGESGDDIAEVVAEQTWSERR